MNNQPRENNEQRPRRRRRGPSGCLIVLLLFVVLLIGGGIYGASVIGEIAGKNATTEEVTVTVEQGEGPTTIANRLADAGVIKRPLVFRYYLRYKEAAGSLQYGEFTLCKGASYDDIIETLSQYVKRDTVTVTFPEGLTAQRMAQLMEENGLCTAEEFLACANGEDGSDFSQYEFWNEIPDDPDIFMKCEGYLFPNTYEFFLDDTVYNYVNTFYAEFDRQVTPDKKARICFKTVRF